MFEPDYTKSMSNLLDSIHELKNDILPNETFEQSIEKYLKNKSPEGEEMCSTKEQMVCDGGEEINQSWMKESWNTAKYSWLLANYY